MWAALALATKVLVGMHPVLTHVPPNNLRSIMTTFLPAPARRPAKNGPACPVPIMIASYAFVIEHSSGCANRPRIDTWSEPVAAASASCRAEEQTLHKLIARIALGA